MTAARSRSPLGRSALRSRVLLALGATTFAIVSLFGLEFVLIALGAYAAPSGSAIRFTGAVEIESIRRDRDLLYRLPPNSSLLGYYRTNSCGYRGPEIAMLKPMGITRIVCVGDSCTFGLGVREEETYSAQLQRALDVAFEGVARFDVVNLGVPGYSSQQNRRQIELEAEHFEADLIVWMPTGVNDASASEGKFDAERLRDYQGFAHRLRDSRVARMFGADEPKVARAAARFAAENADEMWPRVSLDEFEENLAAAAAASDAAGSGLVIVTFELSPRVYVRDPGLSVREEILTRWTIAAGLTIADPRPALREVAPYPVHVDGIHPSPRGNRAIAASIFAALVDSENLLPPSPRRRFLREFLAAGRRGLDDANLDWLAEGAPPKLADPSSRAEPAETSGSIAGTGRRWHAFCAGDTTIDRKTLEQLEERVRPLDAYRRFAFGTGFPSGPRTERTTRAANRLAALDAAIGLSSPPVDRRIGEAIAAADTGDSESALRHLDDALALDPRSEEALFQKVQIAWKARRLSLAHEALDVLRATAPDHPFYLIAQGLLDAEAGRADHALPLLERATALAPMSGEAHFALGYVRLQRGEIDRAEESFRAAAVILTSSAASSMAMIAEARRKGQTSRNH